MEQISRKQSRKNTKKGAKRKWPKTIAASAMGVRRWGSHGDGGQPFTINIAGDNWLCHIVGMARHLRVEFPGAIYHVTCRMVGDAPSLRSYGGTGWLPERCLFRDDADHERCVDCLSERVEQYNIRLYLFVCTCPQCYSVAGG